MIFFNNVEIDSGSGTYNKFHFPRMKAYVGPIVGTYGEDVVAGYVAKNTYNNSFIKLDSGYGFKPGYVAPIGAFSCDTITSHSGWFIDAMLYTGSISSRFFEFSLPEQFMSSSAFCHSTVSVEEKMFGSVEYIRSASTTSSSQ